MMDFGGLLLIIVVIAVVVCAVITHLEKKTKPDYPGFGPETAVIVRRSISWIIGFGPIALSMCVGVLLYLKSSLNGWGPAWTTWIVIVGWLVGVELGVVGGLALSVIRRDVLWVGVALIAGGLAFVVSMLVLSISWVA